MSNSITLVFDDCPSDDFDDASITPKPYSVLYWGSNPDAGNDDCWSDDSFATLAEAEAAFARNPGSCVAFVELDGPDVYRVRKLRDARPADTSWRDEIAREAGMLGGCEAYNEVMGY